MSERYIREGGVLYKVDGRVLCSSEWWPSAGVVRYIDDALRFGSPHGDGFFGLSRTTVSWFLVAPAPTKDGK